MVKNVKQWLKKQGGSTTAYRAISDFLRTYRNVPHTSTGRTPAGVIFKRLPRTHLSMIVPDMTEYLKNQLQPKEELKQPCSFAEDDMVFIRDHRPTSTHKWIEGRVSSKTGALSYIVDLEGHQLKAHVDHLLPRAPAAKLPGNTPEGAGPTAMKCQEPFPVPTTEQSQAMSTPAPAPWSPSEVSQSPSDSSQPTGEAPSEAPQLQSEAPAAEVPQSPNVLPQSLGAGPQPTNEARQPVIVQLGNGVAKTQPATGSRKSSRSAKAPDRLIEHFKDPLPLLRGEETVAYWTLVIYYMISVCAYLIIVDGQLFLMCSAIWL